VVIPGQPVPLLSAPPSTAAVEVAVAAGGDSEWSFGSFEVVVTTPESPRESGDAANASVAGTAASSTSGKPADAAVASAARSTTGAQSLGTLSGGIASTAAAKSISPGAALSLEFFTPPSVRLHAARLAPAQTASSGTATNK